MQQHHKSWLYKVLPEEAFRRPVEGNLLNFTKCQTNGIVKTLVGAFSYSSKNTFAIKFQKWFSCEERWMTFERQHENAGLVRAMFW
jgi:hypothetical protein